MEKVIFHIDINHCYAQIEEMKYPELRFVPMAVGGHEETRHGIILAKNDLAKNYGIKTAESLRDAYEKCPQLLVIPPNYEDYMYYTNLVKDIYRRYSDQVESYGLDEAWVDCTNSYFLFEDDPIALAKRIQSEVLMEVGLTVSIGVSWNKIFAKLGSDLKKPSGLSVITKGNFREKVWPLPVEDLLYVGPSTKKKLYDRGIYTIGALAEYDVKHLQKNLGVVGEVIHRFANGCDDDDVSLSGYAATPKSVGNAMTLVKDVDSIDELKPVLYVLAESVASRLKDHGLQAKVVSISFRDTSLHWETHQRSLSSKTDISEEIVSVSTELFQKFWQEKIPLRAVGISCTKFQKETEQFQVSLFDDALKREKGRKIDQAMDDIRNRFGFEKICRACIKVDEELYGFNPKEDHVIHPIGYFQGKSMR